MSVIETSSIVPRMWRGYDDPGLPIGAYIAHDVSVGDATGSTNTIQFAFKPQGQQSSGRFFNVEQWNAFLTATTSQSLSIQAEDFDQLGPFIISIRRWGTSLIDDGDGHAIISAGTVFPPLPLFLGQEGRLVGQRTDMTFVTANVNTIVFSVVIQGYIWEPRSILAEGGLRRPADSLYGR